MSYEQDSETSFFWGFIFCCLFIVGGAFYLTYQHAYQEGIDDTKAKMHCQPITTVGAISQTKKRAEYNWKRFEDGRPVPLTPRG